MPFIENTPRIFNPQDQIRVGSRPGVQGWTQFGYRIGLTAAAGEQMIWAHSDNAFTPMTAADTFDIAYDGTAGGSTDGAGTTGALALTFFYIDATGAEAVATHTLETDGTDTTSFTGFGINRIAVSSTGTNDVNASNITVTATGAGTTQAFIPAGQGVTQQALFFIGTNYTGIARYLRVHANKPTGGGAARVLIRGIVYNRNVDSMFEVFRETIENDVESVIEINEPIGFNLSATDVLYFVADTDSSNVDVTCRISLNTYRNS